MNYSLSPDKFLTDEEHDHFIALLDKYTHPNLVHTQEFRDVVILRFLLETGCRAQEALNVTAKDFDHTNSRVQIKGLKKSNDRLLPVSKDLFQNLLLLTQKSGGTKPFPISYNHLRRIWLNWRPTEKKLHCLRHSFALRLYRRFTDIKLVKLALGHRSISNTMIYLEFDDQDDLYKILDIHSSHVKARQLPPLNPRPSVLCLADLQGVGCATNSTSANSKE